MDGVPLVKIIGELSWYGLRVTWVIVPSIVSVEGDDVDKLCLERGGRKKKERSRGERKEEEERERGEKGEEGEEGEGEDRGERKERKDEGEEGGHKGRQREQSDNIKFTKYKDHTYSK